MRMLAIFEGFLISGLFPQFPYIRRFAPCGCSLYPKDSLNQRFPGSRDLLFPSAFSLHPKIGNTGVPCIWDVCIPMLAKSGAYVTSHSFVTSGIWSSFNQGFTVAMCLFLKKNSRGGCRARVLETRLICQVDIHSRCQTSGGKSARAARQRLLSRHWV